MTRDPSAQAWDTPACMSRLCPHPCKQLPCSHPLGLEARTHWSMIGPQRVELGKGPAGPLDVGMGHSCQSSWFLEYGLEMVAGGCSHWLSGCPWAIRCLTPHKETTGGGSEQASLKYEGSG